jgi:hypothetical protein
VNAQLRADEQRLKAKVSTDTLERLLKLMAEEKKRAAEENEEGAISLRNLRSSGDADHHVAPITTTGGLTPRAVRARATIQKLRWASRRLLRRWARTCWELPSGGSVTACQQMAHRLKQKAENNSESLPGDGDFGVLGKALSGAVTAATATAPPSSVRFERISTPT